MPVPAVLPRVNKPVVWEVPRAIVCVVALKVTVLFPARVVNAPAAAVVPPIAVPSTEPPVIVTLLLFCSAIVPRPLNVWLASQASAPAALKVPSAGVEWFITTGI